MIIIQQSSTVDLKCEKTFASFILWKKKPKTYIPLVFYSNVEFLAKFFNELSFNPIESNYRWMFCIHNIAYRWMLCICSTSDNSRLKQKCISTTTYNVLYARHHPWHHKRSKIKKPFNPIGKSLEHIDSHLPNEHDYFHGWFYAF